MNGTLMRASVEISAMSQCNNIVRPIPTPTPLTAAISGLSNASITGIRR